MNVRIRNSFSFLSCKLATKECGEGHNILTTTSPTVVSTSIRHNMVACNCEEADTRMLVHEQDALDNGATTCLVRTVDTDMVMESFMVCLGDILLLICG